jgi:DNA-directed RNA polymerase subunit RPC12/RpoP
MSIRDLRCDGCGKEKIINETSDVLDAYYHERAKGKAIRIGLNMGHPQKINGYDDHLLCIPCYDDLKSLFADKKSDGITTCTLCGKEKGYNYLFHINNVFPKEPGKERWTVCEDCKYKVLPRLGVNPYIIKTKGAQFNEEPLTEDFYRYPIG